MFVSLTVQETSVTRQISVHNNQSEIESKRLLDDDVQFDMTINCAQDIALNAPSHGKMAKTIIG